MFEQGIFWLRVATCLYALGLLHSILFLLRHKQSVFGMALATFRTAVILHGVSIVDTALSSGEVVQNLYQTLSICAFLVGVVFLVVEWRYKFSSTSVVLFPLVFVMSLVAALERPLPTWADERVRGIWLVIHILLVLVGYASLLLTAVASVAYLVQEKRLKSKQASALLERLPPLATLDNLISGSLAFAFVFITLGLVVGIGWAFIELGTRWIGDANLATAFITWILLLATIFLRNSAGWRGRKAAVLALTLIGCSAVTWITHLNLRSSLIP